MPESDSHIRDDFGVDIREHRDVMVPMRDGEALAANIYRPTDAPPVPALVSIAPHNKALNSLEMSAAIPPQPPWSATWSGGSEAGDTPYFVEHGYAHVIANARGTGLSTGDPEQMERPEDLYDYIEWVADQEWCSGEIGMSGISRFGYFQLLAASANPPSLKAIFPYDPSGSHPIRDYFPGGMLHVLYPLLGAFSVGHQVESPPTLTGERRERWEAAMANPEYTQHPLIYNILSMKGMRNPVFFDWLLDPFDNENYREQFAERAARVERSGLPVYLGTGWYAYTYKAHVQGNFRWNEALSGPKKMLLTGYPHLERPQHELAAETVRWYDHWLKGEETGIMDEPFGKMWVMGANKYCAFDEWPLPTVEWTDFYLDSWERLRTEPHKAASFERATGSDAFVQQPATETRTIERLRYQTDPLDTDTLVIGPANLRLHAAIDQPETTWIATLKDVGPDPTVQAAREGWDRQYSRPEEWTRPDVHERELTRGWLKASHRAVDEDRSRPGRPFHPLTRAANDPVEPGTIEEYRIGLMPTANLFRRGHRIALDIASMDLPTGVGGATAVEYIPWHVCHATTVRHEVFHDPERPSRLTLPIVPDAQTFLESAVVSVP